MTQAAQDEPTVYQVRLAEDAARQIDDEWRRPAEARGTAFADTWRVDLRTALASLATLPGRCPPAPENSVYRQAQPGGTLRQLLYRRRSSGPIWRLLFTPHEQTANDPPTVHIHQVRHGGQSPLTQWPAPADDPEA